MDEFHRLNQLDVHAGKLKPLEASAATEIQNTMGGTLQRISDDNAVKCRTNFAGIDGWLDGVPVQLKIVEGKSISSIRNNIVRGAQDMSSAGHSGDMYIDASRTGFSMNSIIDHAKLNSPISNVTTEGVVKNIYIKTQDGWLNITSGSK